MTAPSPPFAGARGTHVAQRGGARWNTRTAMNLHHDCSGFARHSVASHWWLHIQARGVWRIPHPALPGPS